MLLPEDLFAGIRIQKTMPHAQNSTITNNHQEPEQRRKCSEERVHKQAKEYHSLGYGSSCSSNSVVGVVIAVEKECELSAVFGVPGKLLEGSVSMVIVCTKWSSCISFGSSVVKVAEAGVGGAVVTKGIETGADMIVEGAVAITIGLASLGLPLGSATLPAASLRSSFGGRCDEVLPVDDGLIGLGALFAEGPFEYASSEEVREGILEPCDWFVLALGVFRCRDG